MMAAKKDEAERLRQWMGFLHGELEKIKVGIARDRWVLMSRIRPESREFVQLLITLFCDWTKAALDGKHVEGPIEAKKKGGD